MMLQTLSLPKYKDWAHYNEWLGMNGARIMLEMMIWPPLSALSSETQAEGNPQVVGRPKRAEGQKNPMDQEISRRIIFGTVVACVLCSTATARAQVEFRDVTQEQGILHPAHTEHAFFDFNNDGLLDLLTNT